MDLKLQKFKISIRISIISLFILLLSLAGTLIISINHITLNKILLRTSQSLIQETSSLIKNRFQLYLLPLDRDIIEASNLLRKGVIDPANKSLLGTYLFELIDHNPDIYGVYWGTPEGNFYGIDRESKTNLALQTIVRIPAALNTRYELDENGETVKTSHLVPTAYDPRNRPWYIQAAQAQKLIWTDIYSFHMFAGHDQTLPGITAAIPVYNAKHELQGILGIDLTINRLAAFINDLSPTPNTVIYVTDQANHLVSLRMSERQLGYIGKKLTPELIQQLGIPVPAKNITEHSAAIVSYELDGKEYYTIQQALTYTAGHTWYVTIIVPAEDIIGPLKNASLHGLLLTIICLLGSLLVVRYISQRISEPIISLANEAKALTNLQLAQPTAINTMIEEISYMDEAFEAMRSSLHSFQRYVPSSLVKNLISSGKIAEVGGETRELSCLFSDIRGFTQLTEHTDPQQLMKFLSAYFESMTQAIIQAQGTLDKYIGDGIMAFWNAPLVVEEHARLACQTAVDMLKRLHELNDHWQSQGFPRLELRIGINTGSAIVGNVGSQERLSYTAIGDSINLGSRLEALNKLYGTQIIVSQATYDLVQQQFKFRFLDKVAVRGKQQGVNIYELLSHENHSSTLAYQQQFSIAFKSYEQGDWLQALLQFTELASNYPSDISAKEFIKRCKWLIETNPSRWDGIWRME